MVKKIPARQIAYSNKLLITIRALLQRFNHIWTLQKAFFVFSEVAENALVSGDVTKSVSNVSSLHINHCSLYSPRGFIGTCVKVVQDDNPHLHRLSTNLSQIYWRRKAADTNVEISTPSDSTHVQHFLPGENGFRQWVWLVETCESFIWDGIETNWRARCARASKFACLCQSIEINNNKHVYRQRQVRKPFGSKDEWAECLLIIGTGCRVQVFSLILDSSVGLSAGIQSADE